MFWKGAQTNILYSYIVEKPKYPSEGGVEKTWELIEKSPC